MKPTKTFSAHLTITCCSLLVITVWLVIPNRVATSRSPQVSLPDGVAIQCDCGGERFIMQSGERRPIPDDITYLLLGYISPRMISKARLDSIPLGKPFPHLDSNLIQDAAGTTYLVRGGWKWGIPGNIWNDLLAANPELLDRNNIQIVADDVVKNIPGYEVTPNVLSPAFSYKERNSRGVLVIEDGKARPIPDDCTRFRLGYSGRYILHIPDAFTPEIHKNISGGPSYPAIPCHDPTPTPTPTPIPCMPSNSSEQVVYGYMLNSQNGLLYYRPQVDGVCTQHLSWIAESKVVCKSKVGTCYALGRQRDVYRILYRM